MESINDMLKNMGMGAKPTGRPQTAVNKAIADLKTPANRQSKAAKELKLTVFNIEWPKVKPQKQKNYFVINNKEDLIKYFEKCAENGICSFDYETGPTKETRIKYANERIEINAKLDEMKEEYEVGLATLSTLKEQKALTKIYEKRVAEYTKAVIKPLEDWYASSTFCPYAGEVTTVSLSAEEHESAVIYLTHTVGENFKDGPEVFWELFREHITKSSNIIKVAFNAKFESKFSLPNKAYMLGVLSDPMIAMIRCCQIVKPQSISNPKVPYAGFGLKDKTKEILGHDMMHYSDLLEKKGVKFIADISTDDEDVLSYSAEDSDYSLQLHNYWKQVAQQIPIERERLEDGRWSRPYGNYWEWLCGIEMSFTKVTAMMEYNGIDFNMEQAEIMQKDAEEKFRAASDILVKIGEKYDVVVEPGKSGTTASVKSLLFETLKCPVAKVSVKTDAESLDVNSVIDMKFMINNKLKTLDEEMFLRAIIPEDITEKTDLSFQQRKKIEIINREEHPYKEDALASLNALALLKKYNTLLGTHIIGRKEHVNRITGRVHASYDPWTETSRLSSSKPNGQNIPRPDNDIFGVRNLHRAPEGKLLYLVDFSGFELRIIAWRANETTMLNAFRNNEDLHRKTAATLYGIPENEVTKLQRADGKTGNFLFNYGGGPIALQEDYKKREVRKTEQECEMILQAVNDTYPGLQIYSKDMIAFAQDNGYVETIFGYKRLLPMINSSNNRAKGEDERRAGNTPIQGSAADIMKISQLELYERIANNKYPFNDVKMCAQVHDEVILEIPDNIQQLKDLDTVIKSILQREPIPNFPIEIIAESSVAKVWGQKQDFNKYLASVEIQTK